MYVKLYLVQYRFALIVIEYLRSHLSGHRSHRTAATSAVAIFFVKCNHAMEALSTHRYGPRVST